jgi:translation elongation factor EF-G
MLSHEAVRSCRSGEIAALFGVDCNSGDTFTTGTRCTLTSMFVPPAVVSLAINMSKARTTPLDANVFTVNTPAVCCVVTGGCQER